MKERNGIGTWNTILILGFFIAFAVVKLLELRFPTAVIELKGERLSVLVAKNNFQQRKGLGGREALYPYDGMLFLFFSASRQQIVMRDMNFPIDIVWLRGKEVVDMAKAVMPELGKTESELTRYTPRGEANMVLELPAGWVDRHGLLIGDTMQVVHE